jgi:hypothetical protein
MLDTATVIGTFDAVHHRSTFQRHQAPVVDDTFIGQHATYGHGQIQVHRVARPPGPLYRDETLVQLYRYVGAIHLHGRCGSCCVEVMVEIARYRSALRPSGNA